MRQSLPHQLIIFTQLPIALNHWTLDTQRHETVSL